MALQTPPLTQEEVRRLFDYNPETGELRWRVRKGRRGTVGKPIGSGKSGNYLTAGINKRIYKVHRIIWLWWYGYLPEIDIDHIDRDRTNNRVLNLREVSRTCNRRNCRKHRENKSGVTGVNWTRKSRKWRVMITVDYRPVYLGELTDFTEAVAHRLAAEQCLDWAGCDSNSSAYQYMKRVGIDN